MKGRQAPRVLTRPAWTTERIGDEAIALTAACGQELLDWQKLAVRVALAEAAPGKWAATEVGMLVARQNGKGGVLEAIALWSLFVAGGQTLWSAHQFKTAHEAYLRVKGLIEANEDLAALVVKWDGGGTGEHLIELSTGARLHFIARSMNSGRGFSPRLVILDEAQELSQLALRAMRFATSAKKGRQLIFTGTVPSAENDSSVWTDLRDRGRKGNAARLAWLEWSPENSHDPRANIDHGDRRAWAWSNPSLGYLIELETIEDEYDASKGDPEGFAIERLSLWPDTDEGTGVLDIVKWGDCAKPLEQIAAPIVLAIEVEQDRSAGVMVMVGTRSSDELPQIEVAEAPKPGTAWIPERVVEIVLAHEDLGQLVIDSRAAAAPLVTKIRTALDAALEDSGREVEIVETSWADVLEACPQLFDAIDQRALVHGGSPTLLAGVKGAEQKLLEGGSWVFSRKTSTNAPALYAMTLGLWAWSHAEDTYSPLSGLA